MVVYVSFVKIPHRCDPISPYLCASRHVDKLIYVARTSLLSMTAESALGEIWVDDDVGKLNFLKHRIFLGGASARLL